MDFGIGKTALILSDPNMKFSTIKLKRPRKIDMRGTPMEDVELRVMSRMERADVLRMKINLMGSKFEATIDDLDCAIDQHWLWAQMTSGRWWQIRRNGATKRWKREPERFKLPFKYGLKGYGSLTETVGVRTVIPSSFIISETDPNPKGSGAPRRVGQ